MDKERAIQEARGPIRGREMGAGCDIAAPNTYVPIVSGANFFSVRCPCGLRAHMGFVPMGRLMGAFVCPAGVDNLPFP